MNKHDELAVESMCKCGMSLETLYTCFPQFSRKEIKAIFERTKDTSDFVPKKNEFLSERGSL